MFRPQGYDRQFAELMQALVDFVAAAAAAAQGTGLRPLQGAWKGLLGLPSYGVLVEECSRSALQLLEAVNTLGAHYEELRAQQQQLEQQHCEDGPLCLKVYLVEACCWAAGRVSYLLCSLAASRYTCNGLSCSSLGAISESFALVRGKACVCGCCVAQASAGKPSGVEYR